MKSGAHETMKYADIKSSIRPESSYTVDSHICPATKEPDPMSINVPDPGFHDFDKDRTEKSFGENQVWAAYDDDNGMPHYFVMIHGKYEVNRSLNSFSHKVKWSKGQKGTIQIYPRKGDVWALYRNWSTNWNELTPDEVIHIYDMVEVLED
ncbi:hypothetical protein F3Y22_tig00111996pilonHSYRG00005 [Hibiscus syriacus]|uniref:DUF3444 domain-containing protein n=1 Tax=Hibiscus syriacus TaxID=106335 RepID=A0A6A2X7V4_HIBSY|nr:hypothetical protein F3Y22_tig00111996pilonHSYRG00005 [Hibiscus syriacus]